MSVKKTTSQNIQFGEYNGNPTVSFLMDSNDTYPFSFGAGKARKLLAALEIDGPEAVMKALRELVGKCSPPPKSAPVVVQPVVAKKKMGGGSTPTTPIKPKGRVKGSR